MSNLHRPRSIEEAQEIIARAPNIRAIGSRHSFNSIADAPELITFLDLPANHVVDRASSSASFNASLTHGSVAMLLDAEGLALHNLASLPHVSAAGAAATATHGSGVNNGCLATGVAGIELITSDGNLLRFTRGDPDFDGVVVGLGALGAVVRMTLDVEPAYNVRQRVFEGLPWRSLFDHFDEIMSAGYSVSLFTRYAPDVVDQVWMKSRVLQAPEEVREDFYGAEPSVVERHPVLGMDPVNCTQQLGVAGPWWDRLPHFRIGFSPSVGDELQSEYMLPQQHALAAIEAMRTLSEHMQSVLLVSEIRTIAADRLWMSPFYERDSVALHFTWLPDRSAVLPVLQKIESALALFQARPHWGKLFCAEAATIRSMYARLPDFVRLVHRLDPRGAFRNAWLEQRLGIEICG